MILNGPLAWQARKAAIVPDSTAEAEISIASRAAKATAGIRMKLEDMGYRVSGPTAVLTDNSAAYGIITKPGQTSRTSHFERATMLAKRLYQLFVITPYLVVTALMVADIFTKALGEEEYLKFRAVLMNERLSVMLSDAMGRVVKLGGRAAQLWNRLVSHCVRT